MLRGRACQHLPSGSVQDKALGYSAPTPHCLSFHFTAIDGAAQWVLQGKPQSLEPFEKLSECWHMPFKHGLKWILITPLIEQAGKHLSANISQGRLSEKNENAQLKIKLAFHLFSCF